MKEFLIALYDPYVNVNAALGLLRIRSKIGSPPLKNLNRRFHRCGHSTAAMGFGGFFLLVTKMTINTKRNVVAAADDVKLMDAAINEDSAELIRIGEMAKLFGVTMRTLRFYEDKELISPLRVGNTRLYRKNDITRLKLVLLGRKVGFSLRDVKQMMDLYDPKGSNVRQLKVALEKSERQLERLFGQREAITEAIDELQSAITTVQHKLSQVAPNATA